ncbi:hypothetical protein [Streptomyces sp. NPDC052225]|uniref:hypothetical protein n=1 Tax=Streptomyces sp. NPDC052225 TaxID=3154949 RepID=UPI003419B67F
MRSRSLRLPPYELNVPLGVDASWLAGVAEITRPDNCAAGGTTAVRTRRVPVVVNAAPKVRARAPGPLAVVRGHR